MQWALLTTITVEITTLSQQFDLKSCFITQGQNEFSESMQNGHIHRSSGLLYMYVESFIIVLQSARMKIPNVVLSHSTLP